MLDNLLLVDIYNRAKKLHIDVEARRIVFIIETKYEKDNLAMETIKSLFAMKTKDFITAVDEKNIILVKELKENEALFGNGKTAKVMMDMLNTEAMSSVRISYGTIVMRSSRFQNHIKRQRWLLTWENFLHREKYHCVQHIGNRALDLSASYSSVQDVYAGNLRRTYAGHI